MSEELKQFNINLEDIEENNNLFENLNEAIEKMKLYTLKDRFEVVLNNNLIETKEKLTNFKTILGCRISYDYLDKNVSFIVKEDNKPTYEELETEIEQLKEKYKSILSDCVRLREQKIKYKQIIDKTIEYIHEEQYVEPKELFGLVDSDTLLEILGGDE